MTAMIRCGRASRVLPIGLALICALWFPSSHLRAIPNVFIGGQFIGPVIPAFPRFKANLTTEFLTASNWEDARFSGPWQASKANAETTAVESSEHMTAMPVLFGAVPESVVAYSSDGRLREMVLTYLNAGSFFTYKAGGEKTHAERRSGSEQRSEFNHHYNLLSRNLQQRLEQGCGQGEQAVVGRSNVLRMVHIDYLWEDFVIRLTRREGHSVELRLMRQADRADSIVDPAIAALNPAQRRERLAANVSGTERGDSLINGIPMSTQGYTPYCGIHSLEMTSRYLGLRLRSDELAAAADFRNTGSARGSNILGLYKATAEELGVKISTSSRFDFDRARRSVEAGLPVIVWRRVTEEREVAHSAFAAKLSEQPSATLLSPSKAERAAWPERNKKGSPSHASVISGINAELDEVIFTDPWGEAARNRRMHSDEMEATAYTVFYFEI